MPFTLDRLLKKTDAAHKAIHQHSFNKAKKKSKTVLPYLRKHEQMYWVYLALEDRYGEVGNAFPALQSPMFLELFKRSEYIKQDIRFMRRRHGLLVDAPIPCLDATQQMLKKINSATPHQWLGYFLVRILADLNGGQFVRSRLNTMYGSPVYWQMMLVSLEIMKRVVCQNRVMSSCLDKVLNSAQASSGTAAYQFSSGIKESLESILPQLVELESEAQTTLGASEECFGLLSNVYTQLFDTRFVSAEEVDLDCDKLKLN